MFGLTNSEANAKECVRFLLAHIGDLPDRPDLLETPDRVIRSYKELFSGYKQDISLLFKTFEQGCDEMVICKDIEIYSTCAHHMLPFFGKAHIAYLPAGKVIGLSKLARLAEAYARRLQIQENLTQQIAWTLDEYLKPRGSAVVIQARHLCMCARGVGKQHSSMITSCLTGLFREDPSTRAEFFHLIKD